MPSQNTPPGPHAPWDQLAADRHCPNCDLQVHDDWAFCEYCGVDLVQQQPMVDDEHPQPAPSSGRSVREQVLAVYGDSVPSAAAVLQTVPGEQTPAGRVPAAPPTPAALGGGTPAQPLADVLRGAVPAQTTVVGTPVGASEEPGLAGAPAPVGPDSPDNQDAPGGRRQPPPLRAVLLSAYEGAAVGVLGHHVHLATPALPGAAVSPAPRPDSDGRSALPADGTSGTGGTGGVDRTGAAPGAGAPVAVPGAPVAMPGAPVAGPGGAGGVPGPGAAPGAGGTSAGEPAAGQGTGDAGPAVGPVGAPVVPGNLSGPAAPADPGAPAGPGGPSGTGGATAVGGGLSGPGSVPGVANPGALPGPQRDPGVGGLPGPGAALAPATLTAGAPSAPAAGAVPGAGVGGLSGLTVVHPTAAGGETLPRVSGNPPPMTRPASLLTGPQAAGKPAAPETPPAPSSTQKPPEPPQRPATVYQAPAPRYPNPLSGPGGM
ncbi:zinc ribbon domain-containing protein [Kineosporia sp. J2-2]|uniref:Zinc ribbon domain-containing protein n=1 Tax=Kineosporia corallincola TaxID=2835133 RepID=A0ABS5TB03_9ACTN|nr:zinc ribbon domain-containing protein [Kineosporia corallincola]MBT0768258.1 zinc ribbon domain-containing protein [Kineosporia corallincola]